MIHKQKVGRTRKGPRERLGYAGRTSWGFVKGKRGPKSKRGKKKNQGNGEKSGKGKVGLPNITTLMSKASKYEKKITDFVVD